MDQGDAKGHHKSVSELLRKTFPPHPRCARSLLRSNKIRTMPPSEPDAPSLLMLAHQRAVTPGPLTSGIRQKMTTHIDAASRLSRPPAFASIMPCLLFLGGLLLAVLPLRAEVVLTPIYQTESPPAHSYMIGLTYTPPSETVDSRRLVMLTTSEAWESATATNIPTTFSKVFDPTLAGVRMYEDSLAAYLPGPDLYVFTGGLFDPRLYTYSRNSGMVTAEAVMEPFNAPHPQPTSLPSGLVARDTSTIRGSNPDGLDVFASSGVTASLYRFTAGASGSQTGIAFGNSGAGQVSSGVGALAMGPDGRLNVLDTGRQEILQFDAETLDYLGGISLVNTTTDNTAFTISSTGYIFTANQITVNGEDLTGTIYDYASGLYVGTFSAPSVWGPGSHLGKLAMTADDNGYVYIVNDNASWHVQFYDTNVIPEPPTTALLVGAGAIVFACARRRPRKT